MLVIRCTGRASLDPDEAAAVAAAVRAGGVVLFPTDTLYGLGADPASAAGIAAVYRLKGREAGKPLPVLIADDSFVTRFAAAVPDPLRTLMARFWPGPLTLLFPARPGFAPGISAPGGTVALRVPGSAICRAVLRAVGGALTGTSANPAGAAATGDPGEALRGLAGAVDVLLDAGALPPSPPSTLLGTDGAGVVRQLRAGAVPEAAWRRALADRR